MQWGRDSKDSWWLAGGGQTGQWRNESVGVKEEAGARTMQCPGEETCGPLGLSSCKSPVSAAGESAPKHPHIHTPSTPPAEPGRRHVKMTQRLEGCSHQPRDAQNPEPRSRGGRKVPLLEPLEEQGPATPGTRREQVPPVFGCPVCGHLLWPPQDSHTMLMPGCPLGPAEAVASSRAGLRADAADGPVCSGASCHRQLRHLPGWI